MQLSQPTSRRDDERKSKKAHLSLREKTSEVTTNVYLRENVRKTKRGLRILKIRVRELFTHGKGISTPRARHKGRQPLIECAQHDFKIIYFPKNDELLLLFYYLLFFLFFQSTRVLPLLLRIPSCDEEIRPTQFFMSECLCIKLILHFLKDLF